MAIFRQYILPFLIVIVFLVSLVAVSARAFLPGDMAVPAPIEEPTVNEDSNKAPAVSENFLTNLAPGRQG